MGRFIGFFHGVFFYQVLYVLYTQLTYNLSKKIHSSAEAYALCKNRSSHQRSSVKKVFLEISQNSQENTSACLHLLEATLLEKYPNTEFFLVRIFPHSS